jgi:UDP-N-acetylmuramoyl-tripeptide--D-alanyl-D-alanine ligase
MKMPILWTIDDLTKATKGELLCPGERSSFSGVSIDSRNISESELFVAIKGQNYDGHSFIGDLVKKGIGCFVVESKKVPDVLSDGLPSYNDPAFYKSKKRKVTCIAVKDTTKALGDLASFQRKRANVSVIAITGSNGKTTTREMAARILEQRFDTLSTQGNLNNEIGLPLTLLKLGHRHRWVVLELGMNSPGEIGRLTKICRPDIGIITNIGPAHLEGLGSVEGVKNAKGELIDNMNPDSIVILNADDPMVLGLAEKRPQKTILFGLSQKAMIRATSVVGKEVGNTFMLNLPKETVQVDLQTPGSFMVSNALAAAATGDRIGFSAKEIKKGIEEFKPIKGRMNLCETKQGVHVIDDTYNANPVSMEAAVKSLVSLKGENRGIFIVGDMFELGRQAESLHEKIGKLSAELKIARLYASGDFAGAVAKGAMAKKMRANDIITGTKSQIIEDLKDILKPGDWVLVKGSRAMGMEKIVEELKNWE